MNVDTISHIAAVADLDVLISIYTTSKAFSFLKSRIQQFESERSFMIGCIIRSLMNSGELLPSDVKKSLTSLKKESLTKLRLMYQNSA